MVLFEIKVNFIFIFLFISSSECFSQDDKYTSDELKYTFLDRMDNKFYMIDGNGKELVKFDCKDILFIGLDSFNHFNISKQNLHFKNIADSSIFSINSNGIITKLSRDIKSICKLNNEKIVFQFVDRLELYDAKSDKKHIISEFDMIFKIIDGVVKTRNKISQDWFICDEEIKPVHNVGKVIPKENNYVHKILDNKIFAFKEKETKDWFIANEELEPIHNLGKDVFGFFNYYGEGWTLVFKPDQDKIFYHISGKSFNISKFLEKEFEIKISDPNQLRIKEVSHNIIGVEVGYAYFDLYYIDLLKSKVIWKSEGMNVKSGSSFKDGYANLEIFDTSFEESVIESEMMFKNGLKYERTYKNAKIDTLGKLKDKSNELSFETENTAPSPMEIKNTFGKIEFSDRYRSLVSKRGNKGKKQYTLIDNKGEVYWKNIY